MGKRRRGRNQENWWTSSTGGMQHWLAVTIGVLTLVTCGVFLSTASRGTDVAAVADYTPPPMFAPSPSATPEPKPTAAFLGDSFSPAMGQPVADYNYAAVLSKRMGWEPVAFGQGGTGYTNPGQADEGDSIFADRVDAIVAAAPSVVFVQGSTNDRGYDLTLDAATSVLSRLRDALPDARIIAVGPLLTPTLGAEAVTPARNAVRDAASETGVSFIDPLEERWLSQDRSLFVDDGVHPSGTGQTEIAAQLARAVQPILGS